MHKETTRRFFFALPLMTLLLFLASEAFTVTAPKTPIVTGIDPPFGCTCERIAVTIKGVGFVSTPVVEMRPAGMPVATATRWESVAFVDGSTLTAVVPAGTALGLYDVTVTNPRSNRAGKLPNGFRVVSQPLPHIFNADPSRTDTSTDPVVTVTGANFRNPVKLELVSTAGTAVFASGFISVTSTTSFVLTVPVKTNGIAVGVYLVRVTNLDEMTYSTWSSFAVTSPSAELDSFTSGQARLTARRELGSALALNDYSNHSFVGHAPKERTKD